MISMSMMAARPGGNDTQMSPAVCAITRRVAAVGFGCSLAGLVGAVLLFWLAPSLFDSPPADVRLVPLRLLLMAVGIIIVAQLVGRMVEMQRIIGHDSS